MKGPITSLLCALLLAPLVAAGQEDRFLDLMYALEPKLEPRAPFDNFELEGGSGLSLRGRAPLGTGTFLQGEYVANEYEEAESGGFTAALGAKATILRGGLGTRSAGSPLYALLEYVKQEIDLGTSFDDSGYAVSLGLQGASGDASALYAQVGYLDIGEFGDGFEYTVGGTFAIGPRAAILVDYRSSAIEDAAGDESKLSDLRLGLRLRFSR